MRVSVLRSSGVVGLAAAGVLAAAALPASAATAAPGEGSAYGASAKVTLLPGVLGDGLTVDTGKLAATSTSGPTTAQVVDAPLEGIVTAKAIRSSAEHSSQTGGVTADASIVDATLPVLRPITGTVPSASVISAECASTAGGVTGSSKIVGLDLGTLGNVPVAAAPNTVLDVPEVAKIIVNEQIHNSDGSLTVNALHIKLLGGTVTGAIGTGDIVLSSATCGKATTVAPASPTAPPASPAPSAPAGNAGGGQVSVIPAGAPQTGDGTLAGEREGQA